MSIRRVNSGEPITAFWANSIVSAIDTISGNRKVYATSSNTNRPIDFNNSAGFQIQMTPSGCWTIEAGTIYVNGQLIQGKGTTYGSNSSSLQNWSSCYFYKGKELPKWKIKGYIPKNATGNIADSKFWLINESETNTNNNEEDNPPETPPEGFRWWEQYVNDTDSEQGTIKQLITGSIQITLPVAVATMRPFDITITGVEESETDLPEAQEETTPEEPETNVPEEQEETVKFEVCSGSILLPNKERVFIPQRLELSHSTNEPFFVVLTVKRDATGTVKYKYEIMTESNLTSDGWTFTEAQLEE